MQRAGTLRYMGPPRPGPFLNRPRGDKCSEQGRPSQANRGPRTWAGHHVNQLLGFRVNPPLEDAAAWKDKGVRPSWLNRPTPVTVERCSRYWLPIQRGTWT